MKKLFIQLTVISVTVIAVVACVSPKTLATTSPIRGAGKKSIVVPALSEENQLRFNYYFLEALNAQSKGDYSAYHELLQHALQINPYSAAALERSYYAYLFLGQEDKAIAMIKRAAELDDDNYWYKERLATAYLMKKDELRAIAVCEDMAECFPTKSEPLWQLSELYAGKSEYDLAVKALDRIEVIEGKSELISIAKVRSFLAMKAPERAYAELQSLIAEYPHELQYRNLLGDTYLANQENAKALKVYQEILAEDSLYAPTQVSMLSYYQATEQEEAHHQQLERVLFTPTVDATTRARALASIIQEAEEGKKDSVYVSSVIDRALSFPQESTEVAMLSAQYLVTKKMQPQAEKVLRQILEINPEEKPARLQLLAYALEEQNNKKIIERASEALQYNPDILEFYYYLGLAHVLEKDIPKGLEAFQKGVKQIKADTDKRIAADLFSTMGDLYQRDNRAAEAYAAYDSALVYQPDHINTLNNYAYHLSCANKRLDDAEEMSKKAIDMEPENATYLDTYAWVLFQKKNYGLARKYIDEALKFEEEPSQEILEHAGDIYFHVGEKERALEFWKKAADVKEDPNSALPRPQSEVQKLHRKIQLKRYIE